MGYEKDSFDLFLKQNTFFFISKGLWNCLQGRMENDALCHQSYQLSDEHHRGANERVYGRSETHVFPPTSSGESEYLLHAFLADNMCSQNIVEFLGVCTSPLCIVT
jgi:hypothetical protein